MNKTMDNRAWFMEDLFKTRNKTVTVEERQRTALIISNITFANIKCYSFCVNRSLNK